ncbi:hypothetical protein BELL_0574g00030 [Botrytis elliptica]|uniref:Uncharacterized protein n=1 Tax=Botrytis elliptica TaxID=278938 RepID=A0A4Z1JD25_9HELO|nr:hypothetical protein BELL_0574g00030 [Botrytis elliptica]
MRRSHSARYFATDASAATSITKSLVQVCTFAKVKAALPADGTLLVLPWFHRSHQQILNLKLLKSTKTTVLLKGAIDLLQGSYLAAEGDLDPGHARFISEPNLRVYGSNNDKSELGQPNTTPILYEDQFIHLQAGTPFSLLLASPLT